MPDELYEDIGPSPEHRVGAWVLLAVGILGMGLGVYHWRSRIANAFVVNVGQFKTVEEIEREKIEATKGKDTDSDGISDFDESYVFKTSPYLDDSDSDGLKDKDELAAGSDPNCPVGHECGPAAATAAGATATTTAEVPSDEVIKDLLDPSAAEIRELLVQSGVSREEVDKIDDVTLKQLYAQALLEAQAGATAR